MMNKYAILTALFSLYISAAFSKDFILKHEKDNNVFYIIDKDNQIISDSMILISTMEGFSYGRNNDTVWTISEMLWTGYKKHYFINKYIIKNGKFNAIGMKELKENNNKVSSGLMIIMQDNYLVIKYKSLMGEEIKEAYPISDYIFSSIESKYIQIRNRILKK